MREFLILAVLASALVYFTTGAVFFVKATFVFHFLGWI